MKDVPQRHGPCLGLWHMACHSILMDDRNLRSWRFHGRMVIPNPYPSPPSMCKDPTEKPPRCRLRWVKMLVFLSLPSTKRLTYPLPIARHFWVKRWFFPDVPMVGYGICYIYTYIVILVWGCQKIAISSPPPPQKKMDPSFRKPSHMQGKVRTSWPASIWSKPRDGRFTTKIRKVTFSLWKKKSRCCDIQLVHKDSYDGLL